MKTITILILSAILLVSCTRQNPESPASTETEKIVKQYFEHFNKHDWKKVAEMYTPVADFKDPSLGQGIVKQTRQQ
ncbi:MAG: nuclear transport factor 2 family protein, partial [Bacteroidetes bacterium]|nr:nuclear transport factor 2 family protein [Bacteroidota bacterium]